MIEVTTHTHTQVLTTRKTSGAFLVCTSNKAQVKKLSDFFDLQRVSLACHAMPFHNQQTLHYLTSLSPSAVKRKTNLNESLRSRNIPLRRNQFLFAFMQLFGALRK